MHLDDVKAVDHALRRGLPASESDVGTVDARPRARIEHDARPVARSAHVENVAVGVKRATGTEAVVAEAREDDRIPLVTLGDELRCPAFELDPGVLQFDDDARINDQAPRRTAAENATASGGNVAPGAPGDYEVFLDHVDDVGALEAGRHVEPVQQTAGTRPVAWLNRRTRAVHDLDGKAVGGVLV